MEGEDSFEEKRDRLYREIRYATVTSQTLPPTASVFRLRSKGNQYLALDEYVKSLSKYLDDSHSVTKVTLDDLHQVLLEVEAKSRNAAESSEARHKRNEKKQSMDKTEQENEMAELAVGQHVIVYWDEGADSKQWYLGVIEVINNEGDVFVAHFTRAKTSDNSSWIFPVQRDLQSTRNRFLQPMLASVILYLSTESNASSNQTLSS